MFMKYQELYFLETKIKLVFNTDIFHYFKFPFEIVMIFTEHIKDLSYHLKIHVKAIEFKSSKTRIPTEY